MSNQITTAVVQQYTANVERLLQQNGSFLRNLVRIEPIRGDRAYIEQIGATVAQPVNSRHQDSPQMDTPHSRRKINYRDYEWGDMIDNEDRLRMLIDPASIYATNGADALGRAMDDVLISAATGTAYTGVDGTTAVTLPSTQQIAVDYVETGSATNSGLTIGKLRQARYKMDSNEVSPSERQFFVLTAKQSQDLLRTTEVTSSDYNTIQALVQGKINEFLGFTFVRCERLTLNTATDVRTCFAFAQSGLALGMARDIAAQTAIRADKRFSFYVYLSASFGAARLEEKKVVQVQCDESP